MDTNENLELIINNTRWRVIVERKEDDQSYWMINTKDKVLTVHNYNLEQAKYSAWVQYNVQNTRQ